MRQQHLLNSVPQKRGGGLRAARSRKNSIPVPKVLIFGGLSLSPLDISPDIGSDHLH